MVVIRYKCFTHSRHTQHMQTAPVINIIRHWCLLAFFALPMPFFN